MATHAVDCNGEATPTGRAPPAEAELRRLVKSLHRILRDGEGNSSLIERFDELTKILYCKTAGERAAAAAAFFVRPGETDRGVANRVRAAFRRLVARAPELFPKRFARLRLADATVRRLAEALAPVAVSPAAGDLKGVAYEEALRNTFEKGDHQQFFTPRPLVEFIVAMLGGALAGVVCDPACGTGGFLIGVERFVRCSNGRSRPRLLGFEIDERLAWVAGINLAMHGAARFEVRHVAGAGSLGDAVRPYFGRVDAVVTNPPFGSDLADPRALADFDLGRGRAARRRGVLFIERCLDLLKPGGVLAIIIDDSVLNGPSNADARQLILERSHPVAVVSLPDTAFMPYATVKSSVLFLRKRGPRPAARGTFFARAEVVGRKANGDPLLRLNRAMGRLELDSDLPDILRAWNAGPATPDRTDANGRTFWARIPDADDAAFAAAGRRLDLAYHHPARHAAARALRNTPYPLRTLAELCDVRNEAVVPARDLPDEEIPFVGLANVEAYSGVGAPAVVSGSSLRSTVRRFAAGDLLFAKMRPELRKVWLVPAGGGDGFASAECLVLVPRTEPRTGRPLLLPELLSLLLRSDLAFGQLVHLVIGIGRPRVSRAAVLNVRLPTPPPREQQRLLETYRRSRRAAAALRAKGEAALRQSERIAAAAQGRLVRELLKGAAP